MSYLLDLQKRAVAEQIPIKTESAYKPKCPLYRHGDPIYDVLSCEYRSLKMKVLLRNKRKNFF